MIKIIRNSFKLKILMMDAFFIKVHNFTEKNLINKKSETNICTMKKLVPGFQLSLWD